MQTAPHTSRQRRLRCEGTKFPDVYAVEKVDEQDRKTTVLWTPEPLPAPLATFDGHGWTEEQLLSAWRACLHYQEAGRKQGAEEVRKETLRKIVNLLQGEPS